MHYPTRHPLPTLEDRIVAHLSLSPATRSQLCEALSASATSQGIDVSRVRAVGVGAPIPMGRHARVASDAYPSVEDVASVTGRWWQAVPVVDNTVRMAAFAEGLWGLFRVECG